MRETAFPGAAEDHDFACSSALRGGYATEVPYCNITEANVEDWDLLEMTSAVEAEWTGLRATFCDLEVVWHSFFYKSRNFSESSKDVFLVSCC